LDSPLNRRVTAQTVCRIAGPAAHLNDIKQFMATKYDPTGGSARGTLNNCGHGITPWGTYLGCEENWAVYFQIPTTGKAADTKLTASRARYGVARAPLSATATAGTGQGWHTVSSSDDRFARWNVSADGANAAADFRNEPNTFGYNVEIDPLDPTSTPAKRVAMGRFAHEGAWFSLPQAGKPLAVYMGCDSRNEYIYKFVTAQNWSASDIGGGMAAGDKYLNEGKLYVAKFNSDGANRTPATVNAANPRSYADPDGNKGSGNPNGHIIRFAEEGAAANAIKFRWDIFLFGAEEDSVGNVNLSGLTAANSFSSPDGLWFSPSTGICWIQTDDGAFTDETNC
nr:DUF839 domain-containing protein [Oxalobacteraceae bacterium]